MRSIRKIRFICAMLLLFSAFLLWGWVLWPVSMSEKTFTLPEAVSSGSQTVGLQHFFTGSVQIRLTWPAHLHTGETGEILAQLFTEEPAVSDTHPDAGTLMGEVRIDMPMARLDPPGSVQQTFSMESLPVFHWKIHSDHEGTMRGQFWFYLLDVSLDGGVAKQPLLSIPIEMKTGQLFGFPENILTWMGAILFGMGLFVLPLHKLF